MAYICDDKNDCGTEVSKHKCDTCGQEYTLCPPARSGKLSDNCMADKCKSYDPANDIDILFMTDEEIAKEKPLVTLEMLKQRKKKIPVTREVLNNEG